MSKFTVNTHHAYLNHFIDVKCNGPISIVDKMTGRHYNFSDQLKIRLSAGKHILATDRHEEVIYIEDAIKLGGGIIKQAFVFDDNPWLFVTTHDRLYITNRDTGEEKVEYNITPDVIQVINSYHGFSNIFLFQTQNDYAIYDVTKGHIVFSFTNHIYSNESIVIFRDHDAVIVYDHRSGRNIVQFDGQYSFGKKFYFVKEMVLYGLNVSSTYINKIEFVREVHPNDILTGNYLLKLEKDSLHKKLYGYFWLGDGEKHMSKTVIELPHYIYKWEKIETSNYRNTFDILKKLREENKDILDALERFNCKSLGINIKETSICWENNRKILTFWGEISTHPELPYHIPFKLQGEEKSTICFRDAIIGDKLQKCDINNEQKDIEKNYQIDLKLYNNEQLLAQSNGNEFFITKEKGKLYLRNVNDDSRTEILKYSFDPSRFNCAYFTSDGKNVVLKISQTEIQLLGIEDLKSTRIEVDGFTVSQYEGVNGYKPEIAKFDGRKPVWRDPITLDFVTEDKMSRSVYMSPDGKYIADIKMKKILYNNLTNSEISIQEKETFDEKYNWNYGAKEEEIKQKIDNRRALISEYEKAILFKKIIAQTENQIHENSYLHTESIDEKYNKDVNNKIERYITNESNFTRLFIDDLSYVCYRRNYENSEYKKILIGQNVYFLNYVSFSYDSKYLSFAAKIKGDLFHPSQEGVFEIYDLEKETIVNRIENFDGHDLCAVWMSIFNKKGDVAFYDSRANAYLIRRQNGYNDVVEAKGKSLLCFSPTGKYIACSDQNYIDYAHHPNSNWGHQPSGNVFIHLTDDFEHPIEQYNDLGNGVLGVTVGKGSVSSAAFTQDEKRLLVVGKDGVVVIRNLKKTNI